MLEWLARIDGRVQRVAGVLEAGLERLALVLVILLTATCAIEVLIRYVLKSLSTWAGGELPSFLLIWTVSIGMALASRRAAHLRLDVLDMVLPSKISFWLRCCVHVIVIAFLGILVAQFWNFSRDNISARSVVLHMSLFWVNVSIVVGSFLSIVFVSCELISELAKLASGELASAGDSITGEDQNLYPSGSIANQDEVV